MSLSKENIKYWWKMIRGKSLYHVNQDEGQFYSFNEIKGYYNDLTQKVLLDQKHYLSIDPFEIKSDGKTFFFPIAIFQYGLACYDLLLKGTDKELMLSKFKSFVEWAFLNQNVNGSWDNFAIAIPKHPYSAMAQGEGASLLIRGYIQFGCPQYLVAAKKAIDFMLISLEKGGTADYSNDGLVLFEFTNGPFVFNGWMFAIFGLMDLYILEHDLSIKQILNKTISSFEKALPKMDNGYWSMYRNDKTIASPFYHRLHIAQLSVLAKYTQIPLFQNYHDRFVKYQSKFWNRKKAFFKKAFQKITAK
jgi:hypothetical protein